MEIIKENLKSIYGIELPNGKYKIEIDGNDYVIYTIKDDTKGCILPGENKVKGGVINSTQYEIKLTELVKNNPEAYLTII